ncbi:hypothetical protein [uncultured Mameliella sp.]|uniref:hypothetical protein n=1 Tax=uncultured Mameliella sp. TaxID=1447087 RepID=UPI00263998EA|nr:hypothetical protein [uncultured Mameliella sp.]
MAQNTFAPLEGTKVEISGIAGPFRACASCGHTLATVSTEPVGTHAGHLTCSACGHMTAYLSRDHMAAMLAQKKGAA